MKNNQIVVYRGRIRGRKIKYNIPLKRKQKLLEVRLYLSRATAIPVIPMLIIMKTHESRAGSMLFSILSPAPNTALGPRRAQGVCVKGLLNVFYT